MLLSHYIYYPEKDLAFLQIPKNASTITRLWKNAEDWGETYGKDLTEKTKKVVVLRDPTERYLSAVNMLLKPKNSMFGKPITFNNYMTTDQHFINQKFFCEKGGVLDGGNVDFFYYNRDVVQQMVEEYGLKKSYDRYNVNKYIVIPEVNQAFIDEYYAMDIELIDSVSFVNR